MNKYLKNGSNEKNQGCTHGVLKVSGHAHTQLK